MEQALKDKLEREGEQKAKKLVIDRAAGAINDSTAVEKCASIITEGAKEFQEKMGRPMTYSEMRTLYG
jgi:hypothetical protein